MIKFVSRGLKVIYNMHFSLNEYIKPSWLKGFIIQNGLERKREKREKCFQVNVQSKNIINRRLIRICYDITKEII